MDRRWVYGGIVVAAGVGLVKLLGRGPKVDADTRLMLMGDSLAVGMTVPFRSLAAEQRIPFQSLAVSGSRIDQWAHSKKLQRALASFRPTLVLVSLGTNDEYLRGDAVARQRPYFEDLLKMLRDSGAEIAWIGPPTLPKPASNGITPMLEAAIPSSHYFHSEQLALPRGPDKLHPTTRGYAGWAGAIWQWLA